MALSAMIPQAAVRPGLPLACPLQLSSSRVELLHSRTARIQVASSQRLHATPVEAIRAVENHNLPSKAIQQAPPRRPQLFVGLPVDVVSKANTLNHVNAIKAGLKALKLSGADGVELPIWWGIVEKEAMGTYDWSAYLELVQIIRDAGLQIHASLQFHSSRAHAIPLPEWLTTIGKADPNIYFLDRSGRRHRESLSLGIDALPALHGKTPVQVYEAFFKSFANTFADFMGTAITDVAIGLGPGGELRYPSMELAKATGAGEFQCYDRHMLALLKQHAEESEKRDWGLSGPHDAPRSDETPESGNFFKDQGGSWETPYGDFFLSWYSEQLLSHGDRVLSAAAAAFSGHSVTISARVPVMHSWYKTRSHPLELTSGYYNAGGRDGYDAVAEMFARNSCTMILTGMELADENQPASACGSPESLLAQITDACARHGVRVSGENSSIAASGFGKIRSNIGGSRGLVDSFTYQRMGASFFAPEHWPFFTELIRNVSRPELHADDLVSHEEDVVSFGVARELQVA